MNNLLPILITSIIIISQFVIDFLIDSKKKKKKIIVGAIILILGLASVWFTFSLQEKEKKKTELSHTNEIKSQQKRFNKLDSINIILSSELKLRNEDLKIIKIQNDSLKLNVFKISEKQKEFLIISQSSAIEVSKSRIALENMGYKQVSRGISQLDKIRMINLLRRNNGSKISLTSIMGDSEALQFAFQLKEIFENAGWVVNGVDQSIFSAPIKGIHINVKSTNYPIRVNSIFESFKVLNMIASGSINSKLGENDVELIIGTNLN